MDIKALENRQLQIQTEHNQLVDKIEQLQQEIQQCQMRRFQLQGAFDEVSALIKDLQPDNDSFDNEDDGEIK